jgi:hypothetical protein
MESYPACEKARDNFRNITRVNIHFIEKGMGKCPAIYQLLFYEHGSS